jgi:hypothetical protein
MCFGKKNGLFLEAVLVALLDRLQEHLHVLGYQMGVEGIRSTPLLPQFPISGAE